MKNLLLASAVLLFAGSASAAYEAGTFTCPGRGHLPANVYVVKKVNVGGETLPYVELTRHFVGGSNGEIDTGLIKGFAAESTLRERTTLMIAAVSLEIVDGKLGNCTFVPETK